MNRTAQKLDSCNKESSFSKSMAYSLQKKLHLSLKHKTISKDFYEVDIKEVFIYGKPQNNPEISLIIVAYNEGDDLLRNLDCWQKQTVSNFEIILVDNGLDGQTVNKLQKFNLTHIKCNGNTGSCRGRNIGAVFAAGLILAFSDADGYNPPCYIENIGKVMKDEQVVAVRGKVEPIHRVLQQDFIPSHYDLGNQRIPAIIDTEGNSAWRKKDYLRTGGFEENLYGGDGLVLQYRMIEFYNYDKESFIYEPEILLYHDYHQDREKLRFKLRQNMIVRELITNRYPFINQLQSYYYQERSKVKTVGKTSRQTDRQKELLASLEKEFATEKQALFEKKIISRSSGGAASNEGKVDFTVVIPCYKLGDFLEKAVDSVWAQGLDSIEIIIVDDASSDQKTKDVLDQLAKRVKVIRLAVNQGVAVARNQGIEAAKGKYILCLDADDTIEPTYLEKAFNIFEADDDVGLVSCWARYYGELEWNWKVRDGIPTEDALVNSPVHTASCFRKRSWQQGAVYDHKLRGYEDWDHWLKILKTGAKLRTIPEYLFNYRVRLNSKVETSNENAFLLQSRIIDNHKELYAKYYPYIIAKKHEIIAGNINTKRYQEKEYKRLQHQVEWMQSSFFWKLRSKYIWLKEKITGLYKRLYVRSCLYKGRISKEITIKRY